MLSNNEEEKTYFIVTKKGFGFEVKACDAMDAYREAISLLAESQIGKINLSLDHPGPRTPDPKGNRITKILKRPKLVTDREED